MGGVEQSCYTLINFPTDSEPHNEMQLKLDLGKFYKLVRIRRTALLTNKYMKKQSMLKTRKSVKFQ